MSRTFHARPVATPWQAYYVDGEGATRGPVTVRATSEASARLKVAKLAGIKITAVQAVNPLRKV